MNENTIVINVNMVKIRMNLRFLFRFVLLIMLFGTTILHAQTYHTIGNGTVSNGSDGYPTSFGSYYYGNKEQFFVSAQELLSSGVVANNYIHSVGFNVLAKNNVPVLNNYVVKIFTTTSNNPLLSGWVTTNEVATSEIQGGLFVNMGWNQLVFNVPFLWNGTDNLVVQICSNNSAYTEAGNASVASTNNLTGASVKSRYFYEDSTSVCLVTDVGEASSLKRPNIRFGIFESLPTCTAPSGLAVQNILVNQATLVWNSTGVTFDVEFGLQNFQQGSGTLLTNVTNNYQLDGLDSGTNYQYYVRNSCSTTEQSFWVGPFSFTTICQVNEFVFENFDTTAVGDAMNPSLPNCWTFIGPEEIDFFSGYGYTTNSDSYSPNNSFSIANEFNTFEDFILVSPQMSNLGNGLKQLRFVGKTSYGVSSVIVGTMLNPLQSTTFSPIVGGTFELTDEFNEFVITIPSGTDSYFAFKLGADDYFQEVFLDNINLEMPSACPSIIFDSVNTTNVLATVATLNWVSTATSFDIEYGIQNFDQGNGTLLTGVANSYVLQGLQSSANYSFYVRSNCGEDGAGEWRGPYHFTTQTVLPSPWFDGFAVGTAVGWNQVSTSVFSLTNSTTGLMPFTDYVLYKNVYSDDHNGAGFTSPNIGPIQTGDKLSFNYKIVDYSSPHEGVDSAAGNIDVFISTDFGVTYSLFTNLPYNEIDNWQIFESLLTPYVGQLVKIKIVNNYNPDSDADYYIGFDNFFIGNCPLVSMPEITEVTENSVTISLEELSTEAFEIEYGEVGFVQGAGTIVAFTGNSIAISDLSQATVYDYYIRRVCGMAFSPWQGAFKFTTNCSPFAEGFVENFDGAETGSSSNATFPICWNFIDSGTGYGYVTSSESDSNPNSFYLYNNSDVTNAYVLVSPETIDLGNGGYRVVFKAKAGSSEHKLKFGTMSSNSDADTFNLIDEISLTTNFQEYTYYLPPGTDDYFAFKHGQAGTYQSIYVDDVIYEPIPNCVEPVNLVVVKNLGNLTAQLSWSNSFEMTNNEFEVEWGAFGFVQGSGTSVLTSDFNTLISDLEEGETYSFYVRRVCADDNSIWVGPMDFQMDYCSSIPTSVDNDGVTNITIDGVSLDIEPGEMFQDFTDELITFNSGVQVPASMVFETGYTYNTNVWIDLNKNGVFENDTELIYTGESTATVPNTLNIAFTVPNGLNNETGAYRMRIGTADSGQSTPNSCYSGSFGFTADLQVNIIFPCLAPTNVVVSDVNFNDVTLSWQEQDNAIFELEYGLAGFAHGTGITVQDVTSPYVVEALTPGKIYDFYVRKVCGDLTSLWGNVLTAKTLCDTEGPTGASQQTLVQDELLSQLVINGQNLKYYTNSTLTQEVSASTAVQSSGVYYVTQTIGCESELYLMIQVNVIPRIAQPIVDSTYNFCDGGIVGDIPVVSLPGATVLWYNSQTSENPLSANTLLTTGNYYVEQTDGVTTSHRLLVSVVVNQTPQVLNQSNFNLCGVYTFGSLIVNNSPGTTVKWYSEQNDSTPINASTLVETGTYHVSQSNGTCESPKTMVQIIRNESLSTPAASSQIICGSGTVADLVAMGLNNAQIRWYNSALAASPLPVTTALATGTYYVDQTVNGCVSDRRAVSVRVISQQAPQIDPILLCGQSLVSDLNIVTETGTTYKWYNSPTNTNELLQNTVLTTGVYYVERIQAGCVSARRAVQVTIGDIPSTPSGNAVQTFVEGATIQNLVMNQNNVIWYITYNDSQIGTNPMSSLAPLVNGATYYGVIIGSNGCPSLPFAVTVTVTLSNNEFVKNELKYYPNPVDDVLNITYSDRITQIEVFDLLGKKVKSQNTDNTNVEVDLSELATGTYMIQLKTENKQQFIKIVKK